MNQMNGHCGTDTEILRGLSEGQGAAFNRAVACLEKNCKPSVTAWLRQHGMDAAKAEETWLDAFTDSWIKLCREGNPLTTTLCGYLFAVARNKWRRFWRDKARPEETWEILPEPPPVEEPEEKIPEEYIEACRHSLGKQCQDILDDFDEGLSMDEIAKKYGFENAHTARQIKYRCQVKFLNCLKARMGMI